MRIKCGKCGQVFDPSDRAGPNTKDGAITQMLYCSTRCKRKTNNARYYARYQNVIKPKNREQQIVKRQRV